MAAKKKTKRIVALLLSCDSDGTNADLVQRDPDGNSKSTKYSDISLALLDIGTALWEMTAQHKLEGIMLGLSGSKPNA